MTSLRIGTRRSLLALAQAEEVASRLGAHGVGSEIVPMRTSGDEGAAPDTAPQGLKGLWIDTILDALEAGEIDLAVHSAKDLPAEDDDGFVIGAVPERADHRDVLITREERLKPDAVIGTSSLRRRAQLLAAYPGLTVAPLRGNVDTRLRKLADGEIDAAVLAAAGLARLGIEPDHARPLEATEMVPAPGQGCLALQCRDDDERTLEALEALDDRTSHLALDAERSLMWRLGGGCALPFGAFASIGGDAVRLVAMIATPDGALVLRVDETAGTPEDVAGLAARALIAAGAEEILAEVVGE
ncbi:MAG: hydroxymethylbilane synthase [Actinomycetota bacterium]